MRKYLRPAECAADRATGRTACDWNGQARTYARNRRRPFTAYAPRVNGSPLLQGSKPALRTCLHAASSTETLPGTTLPLPQDLTTLTVPQLKEQLKQLKLPVSGRKAVLIERLQSALSAPAEGLNGTSVNDSCALDQGEADGLAADALAGSDEANVSTAAKRTRKARRGKAKSSTETEEPVVVQNGASVASGSLPTGVGMSASADDVASTSNSSQTVPQSPSPQLSAEELQGMAAATRIATAVTVEALLEQMSFGDEDEVADEDNGKFQKLSVDTKTVTPWLKDKVAVVDAATEAGPSRQESRITRPSPLEASHRARSALFGDSDAEAVQHSGRDSRTEGRQTNEPRVRRVFGSDISSAINRCQSVTELVSVVAAASAARPMFRIHCCAAIQRAARLAGKEPQSSIHQVHQLVGELSIQLLDQLHQCDVRSLSTLLWSFGRLGSQPTAEFRSAGRVRQLESGYMTASIIACLNMLDDFGWRKARPVDLVDILEGLVRLELDEPDLVAEVLQRLQAQMLRADAYCVAHALWASAKLPRPPTKEFLDVAARRFSRLCSLGQVRPFELTTALTGCVNLDLKDYRLFAAIKQQATVMLDQMQPSEISMMCWALASLNDDDPAFMKRLIYHTTRRTKPSHVPPRVVVNLMWSAARMDVHSLPLVEYALSCMLPQVLELPSSLLVQGLWSFGKMGHFNEKFMDAVGEQLMGKLDELDPHGLSSTLWAYAHLGYQFTPLLSTAASHIKEQDLGRWSPQQLALAAWSLAIVEAGDGAVFQHLMSAAATAGPNAFSSAEKAQLFQVYMKLGEWGKEYDGVVAYLEQSCSSLLEVCRDAWRSNVQLSRYSASRASYEIAGLLTALGYAVQVEQETEDGLMSIDITLVDGEKKVALEVDGPSHFTSSIPRRSLGPTLSKMKSLQHRGWHTISVPLHEMSAMKTSMERQGWLRRLLESAEVEPRAAQAPA